MGHGLVHRLKKMLRRGQEKTSASQSYRDEVGDPFITKRLNGATRVLQPLPTVKLKPEEGSAEPSPSQTARSQQQETAPQIHLDWHGAMDVGRMQDHNEDYYFCYAIDDTGLFVVADGMGGHDAGEVASKLAVETVCKEMREGAERQMDPLTLIKHSVLEANRAVIREGVSKGSNMGTTLGVVFVTGESAYIGSVGDSRVYWIESDSIRQVTEDHSLVAKLAAVGKLTKEEVRNHPKSNLLYRTIGSEEELAVDTFQVDVKKGGCLLLCTDGLWGEVTDEDIHRVCVTERNAKSVCARLIQMANENGGKDNITAVMVRMV